MNFLIAVLVAALMAAWLPAHGGSRVQSDTYTLEQLAPDIYLLKGGRGGNVAFRVGARGVLVIDDQFDDLAPEIKAAIEGVTDKPIKYLVNTHHHGDHAGGNRFFKQLTEIVAHENVRRNLIELRPNDVRVEDLGTPTVTYTRELRIFLDESEVQIFHLDRGHTSGDSVVYFPRQKIVHMGDLYFNGQHPFIDVGSGASTKGWTHFLEGVLQRVPADTQFIPGHGPVSDSTGLRTFLSYLEELRSKVSAALSAGHTREETVQSTVIEVSRDWPERRGKENIGVVYDEVRLESLQD